MTKRDTIRAARTLREYIDADRKTQACAARDGDTETEENMRRHVAQATTELRDHLKALKGMGMTTPEIMVETSP